MIRGLLEKTVREVWLGTVLFSAALLAAMAVLTHVLPQIQMGIENAFAQIPFVRSMIAALLGVDASEELSAQLMQSILWLHPVVLALVWTHDISFCTRVPAGEIDRGTIDLLLGLPVSRRAVFGSETVVWLASGVFLLSCGACGHFGSALHIDPEFRPRPLAVLYVLLNLYCVYMFVGSVSFLVSASSDRRGLAMGIVFAIVVTSFLVNFLAPLWPPAKEVAWLSFMHYYQPAKILRTGEFPWRDALVLLSCTLIAWSAAGARLLSRDICTT